MLSWKFYEVARLLQHEMQRIAEQRLPRAAIYVPQDDAIQIMMGMERNGVEFAYKDDERPWIIWYEDNQREPEVFVGAGAQESARARYEQASVSWNCTLFCEVEPAVKRREDGA